jgi:RimJ/RimL family protein N-acetyltransferase
MLATMANDRPLQHEDVRRIRPALEGELIRLRAMEEDDLGPLNALINDPDVLQHLDVIPFGQPLAGIREWWESTRGRDDAAVFAIETLPGEPIGVCSLEGIDPGARTATLGIWIGQPHWEKGYGTDAMRTLCRFAFEHMNLQRITLAVLDSNPRARAVYEKVGFEHEGTLRRARFRGGRYVDVHVMGLLVEDLEER